MNCRVIVRLHRIIVKSGKLDNKLLINNLKILKTVPTITITNNSFTEQVMLFINMVILVED